MAENVFAVFKSLVDAGTAMQYLRANISCDENLHLLGHAGGAKELLRLSTEQPSEARQPGEVLVSCAQVPEIGPVVCTGAFEPSIEIAGQLSQLGVPEQEASKYVDALRRGYSMLCVSCTKTAPNLVANILAQANPVALPEALKSYAPAWNEVTFEFPSAVRPIEYVLPTLGPITIQIPRKGGTGCPESPKPKPAPEVPEPKPEPVPEPETEPLPVHLLNIRPSSKDIRIYHSESMG